MRAEMDYWWDPPAARVRIRGDVDLDTGNELAGVFESLSSIGCTRVELDLAALTFIDLPVLALLLDEQQRLRDAGGDLSVVAASPPFGQACAQAELETVLLPRSATPPLARPGV